MMELVTDFEKFIFDKCALHSHDRLLLAVSGGVDSVVMCDLFNELGYDFAVVHCNFQLRGEESERDEKFVRQLAQGYGKQIFVQRFATERIASENRESIQVTARKLRYEWFHNILREERNENGLCAFSAVATAHHADDNVETALMNFFRGTGIAGVRGMVPRQQKLVRPLLFAYRKQIEAFAKMRLLNFVEDSSNLTIKYTRNFIRHNVIPVIKEVFPSLSENVSAALLNLQEAEVLYLQAVEAHKKNLLEQKGAEIFISVEKLKRARPLHTVVFELSKAWGFTTDQAAFIIRLLDGENGRYIQSPSHRMIRNRKWLIVHELHAPQISLLIIEKPQGSIDFEGGSIHLKKKHIEYDKWKPFNDPFIAELDGNKVKFPLILRKWKEGDYFYPLGMQKKKKLARFFIDQKLSLLQKENIWVLESDKKIVWVVGLRIDNRFRVQPGTSLTIAIQLKAL